VQISPQDREASQERLRRIGVGFNNELGGISGPAQASDRSSGSRIEIRGGQLSKVAQLSFLPGKLVW